MSRKVSPSRTGSSDFALSIPIPVPSPPLSLITTVWSSAARSASASALRSASLGGLVSGSMSASATIPVSPASSWA